MQSSTSKPVTSTRARPLSVEERRASIIEATMPLLVEFGMDLTSSQIAEASGVAEGTIFRAFGDKETLIAEAVKKFLDPEPLRREFRSIPQEYSLDDKVLRMVELLRKRFSDVFRVMAAIRSVTPPAHHERHVFAEYVGEVLAPHAEQLNWSSEQTANAIRLVTFAASIKHFNTGTEFTTPQLAQLVLYGIAGKPTDQSASPTCTSTTRQN